MDETRYLTASEAADRLGVSLRTVRRRIADGSLPSVKLGGSVRIPEAALNLSTVSTPLTTGHAGGRPVREAAVLYEAKKTDDEEYIRRWNREHWPDSWEAMLQRRRQAFAALDEIRKRTKPPSGPHDTADAMLRREREEFGARLLPYLPGAAKEEA